MAAALGTTEGNSCWPDSDRAELVRAVAANAVAGGGLAVLPGVGRGREGVEGAERHPCAVEHTATAWHQVPRVRLGRLRTKPAATP